MDVFYTTLLEKASSLELVRVLTLSDAGAREFLKGLRRWQEPGQTDPEAPITSETLEIKALQGKIREANQALHERLTMADERAERLASRQFFQTSSLPIQLIIADKGVDDKLCCLAFMVGSEAYRAGERRQGVVGAHYTEDPALVDMYRNLAVVLMRQSGVAVVWPDQMQDIARLDIAGEAIRLKWAARAHEAETVTAS